MQEELEQCRLACLSLCDRLLIALEEDQEDARSFFAGEVYQAYASATDKAKHKIKRIKSKIRNL